MRAITYYTAGIGRQEPKLFVIENAEEKQNQNQKA